MNNLNATLRVKVNIELQNSTEGCKMFADLIEVEVLGQKFQRLTVVDPYNPDKRNDRRKALDFGVALEVIAKDIQHHAKYGKRTREVLHDGTVVITF